MPTRALLIPHRLILYPVRTCQGVPEDIEFGGIEGENDEHGGDHREKSDRDPWISAYGFAVFILPRLVEIRHCGGHEEDRDVDPIGRASDDTVIGIKENGYQREPEQDALQLHAPEFLKILKEKALHDGEDKHREKEQLHMLPRRFVHARDRRDPFRAPEPFVQKMQDRSDE